MLLVKGKTEKTHTWNSQKIIYYHGDKCQVCGLMYWDYTFNSYEYFEVYCDNSGSKLFNITCNEYLMQQVLK